MHLGSGLGEAACKTVVGTRAKRSGMRWTPEGLDALLPLRTAVLNHPYDSFWEHEYAACLPTTNSYTHAMPFLYPKFEDWVDKKTISRFEVKQIEDGPYAGNYKPTRSGIESILTNPANIGWWIPIEGEPIKGNHPGILPEDLFWLIFNKISTHDLEGNRTTTMLDIMRAFPDRTWGAIICHGMRIGVQRQIKEPTGVEKTYRRRTLRDIAYEEEHGIIAGGNATWSCS